MSSITQRHVRLHQVRNTHGSCLFHIYINPTEHISTFSENVDVQQTYHILLLILASYVTPYLYSVIRILCIVDEICRVWVKESQGHVTSLCVFVIIQCGLYVSNVSLCIPTRGNQRIVQGYVNLRNQSLQIIVYRNQFSVIWYTFPSHRHHVQCH